MADDLDLTALHGALQQLCRARASIGSMPPAPATARGRRGAVFVGLVRRAMFWVWPQLDLFHSAVIRFAEHQAALMEELRELLVDVDNELDRMRQELTRLEGRTTSEHSADDMAANCQARIEAARAGNTSA